MSEVQVACVERPAPRADYVIWFTGDTHFHHRKMAQLRGFDSIESMDAAIIERWNELVAPNDDVHHLGDFTFGNQTRGREVFDQLPGRKHLIRGNHDPKWIDHLDWTSIHDVHLFKSDGTRLWLSHYPHLTWPWAHEGVCHLHGHSHGNGPPSTTTRWDVGMDSTGDVLVTLDRVLEVMASRVYLPVDHHDVA